MMPSCFGVMDLFGPGGHLLARAAVEDVDVLGAQPPGRAGGVHGHVAAADHAHAPPADDRRVVVGKGVGLHQVRAGEILVGRVDAAEVLAGHAHEAAAGRRRRRRTRRRNPSSSSSSSTVIDLPIDLVQLESARPAAAGNRPPSRRSPWAGGTRGCRTSTPRPACGRPRRSSPRGPAGPGRRPRSARPGPEPTTATFLPVGGGLARAVSIRPFSRS